MEQPAAGRYPLGWRLANRRQSNPGKEAHFTCGPGAEPPKRQGNPPVTLAADPLAAAAAPPPIEAGRDLQETVTRSPYMNYRRPFFPGGTPMLYSQTFLPVSGSSAGNNGSQPRMRDL